MNTTNYQIGLFGGTNRWEKKPTHHDVLSTDPFSVVVNVLIATSEMWGEMEYCVSDIQ